MAIAHDKDCTPVTNNGTIVTSQPIAVGATAFLFAWAYDPVATVVDGTFGGLTWTTRKHHGPGFDGGSHLTILSAPAPAGLAASTSITVPFSTGVDFGPGLFICSFTGVTATVNAESSVAENFDEAWITPNVVTTVPDTLLFGFAVSSAAVQSNTPHADYPERADWYAQGENRAAVVSRIVSASGTYTPRGTWATDVDMNICMGIAFEAAAEAAPEPPAPARRFPLFSGRR